MINPTIDPCVRGVSCESWWGGRRHRWGYRASTRAQTWGMLTTCIASIMRSMIDIAFIVNLLLIWSIQAAVIWVFYILTKRPCVAAVVKYIFCISRFSRSVAQTLCSNAEVCMMLGQVLTNQTEIFYLSWYTSHIIGKMFISSIILQCLMNLAPIGMCIRYHNYGI